jgi:2-polyprenyl-6-methoxyphenol hydroxylase-like FAD-dependent oxidoreductase
VAIFGCANEFGLNDWELMYNIPGRHHMPGKTVMLYPARQNREARATFFFAAPNSRLDRHDSAQQKQLVAAAFAGEGWEIPHLLDAMWAAPDFYCDQVAQVQMDHWARGRVALLGDAAYCPSPMAGMGTSLALVGAYTLAGELAASAGDGYSAAFVSYQQQMQEAVQRAQKFASSAHMTLLPTSGYQMWMVHQVMRMMSHWPFKGLATSDVDKAANAVALKDYAALEHAAPLSVR